MSEENVVSQCMTCKYGISIKGRIIQRSTIVNRSLVEFDYDEDESEEDEEEDSKENPFGLPYWDLDKDNSDDDEEDEESSDEGEKKDILESLVESKSPEIQHIQNYSPMFFNECFFPYTPEQAAIEKHKAISLPDCVIDQCNRYTPMEV